MRLQEPGKLDLSIFQNLSDTVALMNVSRYIDRPKRDENTKVLNLNTKSTIIDQVPGGNSDDMSKTVRVKNTFPDEDDAGPDSETSSPIYRQIREGHCKTSRYQQPKERPRKKCAPMPPVETIVSLPGTPLIDQITTFHNKDNSESDSESSPSGLRKAKDGYCKQKTHKRARKKFVSIPDQPPKEPLFGRFLSVPENLTNYQKTPVHERVKPHLKIQIQDADPSTSTSPLTPRDKNNSSIVNGTVAFLKTHFGMMSKSVEIDKIADRKTKSSNNLKEEGKSEKRRFKEDQAKLRKQQDKEKEQEKKMKRKNSKLLAIGLETTTLSNRPELMQSDINNIPIFLQKCIQFIEKKGLDSEGLYRVPGNRAHVDLLFQKFEEDLNIDIESLNISVNAVATALKDFFSKRFPSPFKLVLADLEEIAASHDMSFSNLNMELTTDCSSRLLSLRHLLSKLPVVNVAILKIIFQHFVRVSENSKKNSMDSKNLAICWWPTLVPIEFTSMLHFERLRPYLEDIVQNMIDQFSYLYCGEEAIVMD